MKRLSSTLSEAPVSMAGGAGDWGPIGYLNIYRLVLSALFAALSLVEAAPAPLGAQAPSLFGYSAAAYLVFAGVWMWAARRRRPGFEAHLLTATLVDLLVLSILMYASGGVNSGFGMLLVVAVAGGSILSGGRVAFLFAAIASVAVLVQQVVLYVGRLVPDSDYTHGGMLGLGFFATAALAQVAARRIRQSDSLARQHAVDLANLSQLNEHIVQRMQSGIVVSDGDDKVRLLNAAAQSLTGLPEGSSGATLAKVAPVLSELLIAWRGDRSRSTWLRRSEVTGVELAVSFAALGERRSDGTVIFIEDASTVYQRAQQLKLASLGRLTASIAHEIRNPLGAISHAGELLAEHPDMAQPEMRLTEIINTNARRVNEIIENVLGLSRRGDPVPEAMLLEEWLPVFRDEFMSQNEVPGELLLSETPARLTVRFDPGQLRQVLWNLCENGFRHAGRPARVSLEARVHPDSERPYLDVADNGEGLSSEDVEHVFEPFYTTRKEGSGLGLYVARGLCESNQAALSLVPGPGGAHFRISFSDPRRQRGNT